VPDAGQAYAGDDRGRGSAGAPRRAGARGRDRDDPASDQTIETEAGWAFFNVNGYLGTVTPEGDVIAKDELAEDEPPFLDLPDDGGEER
jgi:hypothetical protein